MDKREAVVVQHKLKMGEKIKGFTEKNLLFVLVEGEGEFFNTYTRKRTLNENFLFLIQIHSSYSFCAQTNCTLLIIRIDRPIKFSDGLDLDAVDASSSWKDGEKNALKMVADLKSHIFLWNWFFELGIKETSFWENFIEIFFVLIYHKYSKEDLRKFLFSASSTDHYFSSQIYEKVHDCRTVIELAESLNYSVSGFEKRFKKVFGIPCYKWMRERKAEKIRLDVAREDLSIQEISEKYMFSSVGAFTRFCKDMYGITPALFRKRLRIDPENPYANLKGS